MIQGGRSQARTRLRAFIQGMRSSVKEEEGGEVLKKY